jgi:chemotaxis protein methyltransferase CheR
MIQIKPEEIQCLADYIYHLSGISIDASKAYLLETRLNRLLEEEGCRSFSEFHQKATSPAGKMLEKKIINAMTTNETLFFRDAGPFELLRHKIIPDLVDARSGRMTDMRSPKLKIWSNACSTGQEVYSIAIVIKELLGNNCNVSLMGSDLSDAAVAQASAGVYNRFEIERGLPKENAIATSRQRTGTGKSRTTSGRWRPFEK